LNGFTKAVVFLRQIIAFGQRQIFAGAFLPPRKAYLSQQYLIPTVLIPSTPPVVFQARPQPSFNKNFELLITQLRNWKAEGYEIFICSDNSKQLARLNAILTDLKAKVEWVPIESAISEGFVDEQLKMVVLTDHQIFQRFSPV
jgi:transcription-repair coupling factor (superfamily II helicase)